MKKLPAETVYYVRCAAWEFNSGLIFTSIWVLYYSVMRLSLFDVSLVFVVSTVSNLVLEVPTGILADVYSRRLSVIVGGAFIGLAFLLMGLYPLFAVALLAAFIEAIGDTCVSGALQAWITDEVGVERVGRVFLRGRQVAIPAHWSGVALSIALAAWFTIQAPVVLGGALWFALTVFLVVCMPEENFRPGEAAARSPADLLKQFGVAFKVFAEGAQLVRNSRVLLLLFTAQLFSGAFFSSFYKFSRAHILQGFPLPVLALPVLGVLKENAWFGLLEVLQGGFSLAGMEGVRRFVPLQREGMAARVLLGLNALMLVGAVIFAMSGDLLLALVAWLVVSGLQEVGSPVIETWLNQHIPSNVRSTVISMNSQVGVLGSMGGSTGLGLFGDRFGVRTALGLTGVLLVPLLGLYTRSMKDEADSPV